MFESLTKTFDSIRTRLAGRKKLSEDNIREALQEARMALLEADVNFKVCKDFLKGVREKAVGAKVIEGVNPGDQFIKIIHDGLVDLIGPEDPEINWAPSGPTVILMAGLQGTGKTTTCGKLARHFAAKGRKPLLVAADVQRPAAIEQLQVLGKQIDVPVHAEHGGHPPKICADAVARAAELDCDTIILDTAGRLHVDADLMKEVANVAKTTSPHEIFLVLDANTGQDAVNSAEEFNATLELTGVILTKMDSGTRGGAALSVKAVTGKPIKFVGTGEKLDKLEAFHPERMADRILGMGDVVSLVERAQEAIDEQEAEKAAEQLFAGNLNFDDWMRMVGMVRKMGPFKDLLKLMPGMGGQAEALENFDEKQIDRSEAMIRSMTPQERVHPEILNMSRRERVARGSGVQVQDVHNLIRGFKQMKTQLQKMRKSGMFGNMADPMRMFEKQKKKDIKEVKKSGKSVLDLPAFRSGAAKGSRAGKNQKSKKRRR